MNKLVLTLLALTAVTPSDEYFSHQWYLQNHGYSIKRDLTEISSYTVSGKAGADIHFPFNLKELSGPRKPVVVAVLDTGVDIDHPELKDSILRSSECNSLGQLPPKNSADKDGNGYKGDCAGWNFASSSSAEGDNQVYDDTGHGTHLSGLIAAKANATGIRGISDQIKILPVKIFNKYEIPNHPLRPKMRMMDRIQKGLEYAIQKNVDVINLSLGWPSVLDTPKIREMFDLAAKKNILVVAAAGNNAQHTTIFPCSYASVLCVGATSVDGTVAPFSNYGGNVDLMAPGENILSTIPKKITPLYFDEDGFDYKNGTSQAAPLVAGSAALMKLALGDLSVNELKARIYGAASRPNAAITSLYGDLNLTDAITQKPDQFVYPNLKELNAVEVGYPNGRFAFDLKLDKLLPGVASGELSLALGTLALDQRSFHFEMGEGLDSQTIRVSGSVSELGQSSTQTLSIVLAYGSHRYTFEKELTFALNAEQVGSKVYFDRKLSADNLRSVDDAFRISNQTIYFTQSTQDQNLALEFFALNGPRLNSLFSLNKSAGLKLVAAVFVKKNELALEFYDAANQKLIYEFWNAERGAIVKSLDMVPDSAVFQLGQSTFFEGNTIRAAMLGNGKIPPLESNPSVFLKKQAATADHLYFFEENQGKVVTKLLDSEFFRDDISKRYHLRYDDEISPIAVLTKGVASAVDALFAIGKGYQRKLLLVRFSGHHEFRIVKEFLVPGGAALKEVAFLDRSMLVLQERKDAYLQLNLETGSLTSFEWNDRNDDLLGPIVNLSPDQLLAQTQNHFVVLGKGEATRIPLKRFSFLPGELFSEMFAPVTVRSATGEALPALFIDGTLISEKHLGVVMWDGKSLVKPIYFQEKLPANCRVMNPQRMDGVYQMVLLCDSGSDRPYLLKRALIQAP